jgi:serine/threonine-protein kinase
VLHELLTGARPYKLERGSRAALEEAILRAEPQRPSAAVTEKRLQRALRGDLDTIVQKALKKSPADRYATVDSLADDVARHLDQRPVLAQPDSVLYRLGKLLRRNRLAAGATGAVSVALLVGTGVALWQARQARAEQQRAESVKEFMTALFSDVDAWGAPNSKPTVQELLQQARSRLQGDFAGQPALRVELLLILANGLAGLSDFEAAESMLRQALDEGVPALGSRHLLVMRARVGMADVLRFRGRIPEMQTELNAVRADMDATPGVPIMDRLLLMENATHLAISQGRYKDADTAARELSALATRHFEKRHVRQLMGLMMMGVTASYVGDHERSLDISAEAVALATDLFGRERPHARVFDARAMRARALGNLGRYREAADELAAVVDGAERLFGAASPMVMFLSHDVARFRLEQGDPAAALAYAERSLSLVQRRAENDPFTVAMPRFTAGRAQLALRRPIPALQSLLQARELAIQARGPDSPLVMDLSSHVALALAQQGRFDEAAREVDAGLAYWRESKGAAGFRGLHHAGIVRRVARDWPAAQSLQQAALAALDDKPQHALRRSAAITELALLALEQGDSAAALRALQRDADIPGADQPLTAPAQADRLVAHGRTELALGRAFQAEGLIRRADEYWQSFDPGARWAGEAAYWLSRCHAAQGRHAAAQQALARAARVLATSPFADDRTLLVRSTRQ